MKKYNPAPKGWTVPAADDFTKLEIKKYPREDGGDNVGTSDNKLFFPAANSIKSHDGFITAKYSFVYWTREQAQLQDGGGVSSGFEKYFSRMWDTKIVGEEKSTGAPIRAVRE